MPNPEIEAKALEIATDALAWAQGSWGQGRHDKPRYDAEMMEAIYRKLSLLAAKESMKAAQTLTK